MCLLSYSIGYLGFLHTVQEVPLSKLDATVFQNSKLIEAYLEYLTVSTSASLVLWVNS